MAETAITLGMTPAPATPHLKVASPIYYGYSDGTKKLFADGEDWDTSLPETDGLKASGHLKHAHEFDAPAVVADKLAASESRVSAQEAELEELKQRLTAAQLRADLAEKRNAKAADKADAAEKPEK